MLPKTKINFISPSSLLFLLSLNIFLIHLHGRSEEGIVKTIVQQKRSLFRFYFPQDALGDRGEEETAAAMQPKIFTANTIYNYQYDAQISNGISASIDSEEENDDIFLFFNSAQQKRPQNEQSMSRIAAQAEIRFGRPEAGDAAIAQMCLRQIVMGELNGKMGGKWERQSSYQQQCFEPIEMFEPIEIPEEMRQKLELCCQFDYSALGVIEQLRFDKRDNPWSENIKRGVLNMLQMKLLGPEGKGEVALGASGERQRRQIGYTYSVPETSLEGECLTRYTLNNISSNRQQQQKHKMSITKSINFNECSKIADITQGFQTRQPEPEKCAAAHCEMDSEKKEEGEGGGERGRSGQESNKSNFCTKCEKSRELKQQTLDRSTVMHATLNCDPGTQKQPSKEEEENKNSNNTNSRKCFSKNFCYCQLEETQLRSQYTFRNTKLESNGPFGSAMRTTICARMELQKLGGEKEEEVEKQNEKMEQQQLKTKPEAEFKIASESLLYNNQWELVVQRFYMFGDDAFPDQKMVPFAAVPKVAQVDIGLHEILNALEEKRHGVGAKSTKQIYRVVKMLRMSTGEELKQIFWNAIEATKRSGERNANVRQILGDSMAICGTKNCVALLAEQIRTGEISPPKAAFSLSQLGQLMHPSQAIIEEVLVLCKSTQVCQMAILKQNCWLAFGALVSELCPGRMQKSMQKDNTIIPNQCSEEKNEFYKQAIFEQYKNGTTLYDRIVAIAAFGNSGIESSLPQLEKIINNRSEKRALRANAINALRRLSAKQPLAVQQILLPIFLNVLEDVGVRTAALSMILRSRPDNSVLDQLVFAVEEEPNKELRAFAYRSMRAVADSLNPLQRGMAKHLKHALNSLKLNEQDLRRSSSSRTEMPLFCRQQQEGIFISVVSTTFARSSSLPDCLLFKIDSFINDQHSANIFGLYLQQFQQVAEQFFYQRDGYGQQRLSAQIFPPVRNSSSSTTTKTNLSEQQQGARRPTHGKLEYIYTALGIKSRRVIITNDTNDSTTSKKSSSAEHSKPHQKQMEQKQQLQQQKLLLPPPELPESFALLCVRIADMDRACIMLDFAAAASSQVQQKQKQQFHDNSPLITKILRKFTSIGTLAKTVEGIFQMFFSQLFGKEQREDQLKFQLALVSSFFERHAAVPTSIGLPLQISNYAQILAGAEGSLNIQTKNEHDEREEEEIEREEVAENLNMQINGHLTAGIVQVQKMNFWLPFHVSGVKSVRSVNTNIPLGLAAKMENNANGEQKPIKTPSSSSTFSLRITLPPRGEKTRLFAAHSHQMVFSDVLDPTNYLELESRRRVLTIHDPKMEHQQRVVNTVFGAERGMRVPLHVQGHYYLPSSALVNIPQLCKVLLSNENSIRVTYRPTGDSSPSELLLRLDASLFEMTSESFQSKLLRNFDSSQFEMKLNSTGMEEGEEDEDWDGDSKNWSNTIEGLQGEDENGLFAPQGKNKESWKNNSEEQRYYKNSLKISAQTVGGNADFKCETEFLSYCDTKMIGCQLKMETHQRAQLAGVAQQQKWAMEAEAEMKFPGIMKKILDEATTQEPHKQQKMERRTIDRNRDQQQQHQEFLAISQIQWGAEESTLKQQKIIVRVKGTQMPERTEFQHLLQTTKNSSKNSKFLKRLKLRTSFLNKFNVDAKYTALRPAIRGIFERCLEMAKSAYFWNTNSELLEEQERHSKSGNVHISMVIDSVTQRHANISVQTPSQIVRFQQIQLPMQMRPFPFMVANGEVKYGMQRSFGQMLAKKEKMSRAAECSIDGRSVRTFDGFKYHASLSKNCFSVLAMDCGSDLADEMGRQPQFAVLMRALAENGKKTPKLLKFITPDMEIECQPTKKTSSKKQQKPPIECKVNGENVDGNNKNKEENEEEEATIQRSSDFLRILEFSKSRVDVTIQASSRISVRFNGRKGWLKLSSAYKNIQCGLCAHYDEDATNAENEWRMGNNQIASDFAQFHRSFLLPEQGTCTQQEMDNLYENKNSSATFDNSYGNSMIERDGEDEEEEKFKNEDEEEEEKEEEKKEEEENFDDDMSLEEENAYFLRKIREGAHYEDQEEEEKERHSSLQQQNKSKSIAPVLKTKILETTHQICFSKRPVVECPRGSVPMEMLTNEGGTLEDKKEAESQKTEISRPPQIKNPAKRMSVTAFVCMERDEPEARDLLNQFQTGKNTQLDLSAHSPSMVEVVREPLECQQRGA